MGFCSNWVFLIESDPFLVRVSVRVRFRVKRKWVWNFLDLRKKNGLG